MTFDRSTCIRIELALLLLALFAGEAAAIGLQFR
jgi:hypothetical protein